jgi:uncharacterized membrane protein
MNESGAPPSATFPHPQIPADAYRRTTLLLRVGLVTSLSILLGALIAYLVAHPNIGSGAAIASNPVVGFLTLGGLGHGLATGAPEAYLALGVFILIATPVARVAAGVYYFRRGHERTMTWITLTVLLLLMLGVLVIGPLIQ